MLERQRSRQRQPEPANHARSDHRSPGTEQGPR
jgi:hypothetical protein